MKHPIAILLAFLSLSWFAPCFAQIAAGHGIEIRIMGVPPEEKGRIDGGYSVSTSGTIRMPLIGPNNASAEVSVAGMSTNAAAAKLEALYRSAGIYTNPTFQISATQAGSGVRQQTVTISGFVRGPGPKPYDPNMTLYQAIAAAGGANEFGALNRIILMRGKSSREYNMENHVDRAIKVEPDDTIEVPEKNWRGR